MERERWRYPPLKDNTRKQKIGEDRILEFMKILNDSELWKPQQKERTVKKKKHKRNNSWKLPRTDHDKSLSHRINEMSRTMGENRTIQRHVIVESWGIWDKDYHQNFQRGKKTKRFSEIKNQNVFRLISSNLRSKKTMERYLWREEIILTMTSMPSQTTRDVWLMT